MTLPQYNATQISKPQAGNLFILNSEKNMPRKKPRLSTEFYCRWTDNFLKVNFQCICHDVRAKITRCDSELWNENVFEVFLDPWNTGQRFFEFQMNPLGTIYDSFVEDVSETDNWKKWCKWNCDGLHVKAEVNGILNKPEHRDLGWSGEFCIPFASLGMKAQKGDIWRVNFCRYDYSENPQSPELSCWAPVLGQFDDPENFGILQFID